MVTPGCTKRLPRSGSIIPAAIFNNVDLPEPLRPIRQTRSPEDTDNSTPDNSGVPPKVSAMSFNWISGGAMVLGFQIWGRGLGLTARDAPGRGAFEMRVVAHRVRECEEKASPGCLATPFPSRTIAVWNLKRLKGNVHDKSARDLSRRGPQHLKALREQDTRRCRRAPVRL